jgi:hypothetical protein
MKLKRGTTSKSVRVFISDTSSTTGAGLTGLVYNSAGLTAYYMRDGLTTPTAITLADATLGTFTAGGFKEVSATNMPGVYELGIPNTALAAGTSVEIMLKGAANMYCPPLRIELDAVNYQDSDAFGLSAFATAIAAADNAYAAVLQVPAAKLTPVGSYVYAVSAIRGVNSWRLRDLSNGTIYNTNLAGFETYDDFNAGSGYYDLGWTPLDSAATRAELGGYGLATGNVYQVQAIDYSGYVTGDTGPMRWDGSSLSTIASVVTSVASQIIADHGFGSYERNTEPPSAEDVAVATEAAIINEADASAVLEAIVNKINAMTDLDELTLSAISAAVRSAVLDRALAGNHDIPGTVGSLLQNVDVATSTRATAGDTMAVSAGDVATIVAAVEAGIADDATGEAIKQAIIDKLLENLPDIDELTLAAIAGATRDAILDRPLAGNHDTSGSVGQLLQAAATSAASADTKATAIQLKTDNLPAEPASETNATTNTTAIIAAVSTNLETTGYKLVTLTQKGGNGLPAPGVTVVISTDADGKNVVRAGITDEFGRVSFHLLPGTYYKDAYKGANGFGGRQSFVVAAT